MIEGITYSIWPNNLESLPIIVEKERAEVAVSFKRIVEAVTENGDYQKELF